MLFLGEKRRENKCYFSIGASHLHQKSIEIFHSDQKKISIPQQENIFALNVEGCNLQETSIVIIVVMTFLFLNIKRIFVKRMQFRPAEGRSRYTVKILIFSKLT